VRRLRAIIMRVRGLFTARRDNGDFEAELESHIALHTDEGIRNGLAPAEARRQALIRLGGAEQIHQAHRESRTFPWFESLMQDIHYGLRTLRRTPGFTITAVVTLALGIGSSTAIFSLVNAVLIRSLPYGDPERLVYLFTPNPHLKIPAEVICPSYADFFDLKQQSKSYADMTAFEQAQLTLTAHSAVQRIGAARVDERFFATLESAPELGRAIDADDNQPGRDKVVVISHSLWQSMFGESANVLHQSLQLNGASYLIIGVMPSEFEYPFNSDLPYGNPQIKSTNLWVPLALTSKKKMQRSPDADVTVARLRPDVTIRQAQTEMSGIMAGLDRLDSGDDLKDWGALVESFTGISIGPVRPLMRLLLGAVLLVLLIACGNAANLMLARASGRVRELGVRAALGAGRYRIVRQLLTESLLIGLAACAVGMALAWLFLRVLPYFDPGNIPRLNEASLDLRVLLFTLAASLFTSVLAGILPAWNGSRLQLNEVLKTQGARGQTGGHSRIQGTLIVVQAAMVVVLLAAAGLLIRSYINVMSVDTGFSTSTLTMNLWLDPSHLRPPAERALYFKSLMDKMRSLPGVTAAGAVDSLPLTHSENLSFFWVDGFANQKDQLAEGRKVTPQYFSAMQIPLIAGRLFTDADTSSTVRSAIVNERFAKTYFAGRNPIGARISSDENHQQWNTVIGVVADVRHTSLEELPQPQIYHPSYDFDGDWVAVRATLPPSTTAAEIRAALKAFDSNLTVTHLQTMGDLESEATARRRFQTSLLTAFAAIALVLALVGLYGLMAYSVNRRTQEVGIRMALGAQRIDVMLLVMQNAAWLLGFGLIAGLVCTWITTRALKSFLFGVGDHDPLTILAVCSVLALCGLISAFLPARRAASIDPMQALRSE
jgi:predicted permease